MEHYLLDIALGICLRIFGQAYPQIEGLTGSETVEEDSQEYSEVELILFEPNYTHSFASIDVGLSLYRLEKETLQIEIFGEINEIELEDEIFGDIDLESIIKDYGHMMPVIREGMTHYMDDLVSPEKPIRKVSRTLMIRYRIYDKSFEEDEDHMYNYDIDEIANLTMPYVKSLLDIHSRIYPKDQVSRK